MNRSNSQSGYAVDKNRRINRRRGFSYVEMLMATVIISILFVAALRLFGNLGRSCQVSINQNAGETLALAMIEEIKNLHYKDLLVPGNPLGPEVEETGPNRLNFDDIDDFHGWFAHPPMTRFGVSYTQYPHFSREVAGKYEANLKRLMDLMRAAFRVDDLPVVIGRIVDSGQDDDGMVWDYTDIVRLGQESFTLKDACAALVTSTDEYGFSDKYHFDSAGYIDLGRRFAEAVMELEKRCEE